MGVGRGWKTHQSMVISGVRGWGWGRRKGHKGLLSRPGCICSRGRWVGGTDEGEARTLEVKRPKKRWASGFWITSDSFMVFFLHFSTDGVLNKLTFWRHQVLQQVSADDLCLKRVEKRDGFYLIYNRMRERHQQQKDSLESGKVTFCWVKHVRKFFWKVQHWKKNHSKYLNSSPNSSLQAVFRFITPCQLLSTWNKDEQIDACFNMQHSRSEGSDLTGSNTTEAEDETDPSNEAEDRSCWVTVTGVSVVGVRGEALLTSELGGGDRKSTPSCRAETSPSQAQVNNTLSSVKLSFNSESFSKTIDFFSPLPREELRWQPVFLSVCLLAK